MSSQVVNPNTEAAIFTRLLEATPTMSGAAAEYFYPLTLPGLISTV